MIKINFKGNTMSLRAACKEAGLSYNGLYDYIRTKNIPAQEAFERYLKDRPHAIVPFTEAEIQMLRDCADKNMSATETARILGRPAKSVQKKAVELGVSFHSMTYLSDEEREWIRSHYGKMTMKQMAEKLGVNLATVSYHLRRMGLTKPRTKKEEVIRNLAGKMLASEIAEGMNLTEKTVRGKACKNRISVACPEKSGRRPWTPAEDDILKRYHETEGYKALSRRLGNRTPGCVRTRLVVLGLLS